jgi:HSP20 family protein
MRVVLDERRLLIAGERPRPPAADQVWYRSEIEYGPFEREVALAVDVDASRAAATYERGLLRVVLPVAERPPAPARLTIAIRRIG